MAFSWKGLSPSDAVIERDFFRACRLAFPRNLAQNFFLFNQGLFQFPRYLMLAYKPRLYVIFLSK